MNISLINAKTIIEDSNSVIKTISEEGIKLFNSKSDAIKNVNVAKEYRGIEALKFFNRAFKGDVLNGSESAINIFKTFMDNWKH